MAKKPHLTASHFIKGLQCAKRLWLEVNEPQAPELAGKAYPPAYKLDQAAMLELVRDGYESGRAIDAAHYDAAAGVPATMAALADASVKAVFGAHFLADGVHVVVDVVEKTKGGLKLVKVKASKSPKPSHTADAAASAHAVRAAGESVAAVEFVTLEGGVVLPKLDGLLHATDVTDDVDTKLKGAGGKGAALLKLVNGDKAPTVAHGPHCDDPEECPFVDRCGRPKPEPKRKTKAKTPVTELTVAKDDLRKALKQLTGPLAFLDFETVAPAVPFFEGVESYGQVPVQFSCHVETAKGLEEKVFLATRGRDPRPELAQALVDACKGASHVIQYTDAEKRTIKALAEYVPSLKTELDDIIRRLFDIKALTKRTVQHPALTGYSLKDVVPVLCPEVSYAGLAIQGGDTASAVWWRLLIAKTPPADAQKDLNDLKAYCALDSLAMFHLLEKLRALAA